MSPTRSDLMIWFRFPSFVLHCEGHQLQNYDHVPQEQRVILLDNVSREMIDATSTPTIRQNYAAPSSNHYIHIQFDRSWQNHLRPLVVGHMIVSVRETQPSHGYLHKEPTHGSVRTH